MENCGRRWVEVAGGSSVPWFHSALLTVYLTSTQRGNALLFLILLLVLIFDLIAQPHGFRFLMTVGRSFLLEVMGLIMECQWMRSSFLHLYLGLTRSSPRIGR